MTDIFIRNEIPDDFEAIKEVNNLAFNQKQEGELIENLIPGSDSGRRVTGRLKNHLVFLTK